MNSIGRLYPNLSASELSNIILKGKGKSRKIFQHNPTQTPAGALEIEAICAIFHRHMVGSMGLQETRKNATQDHFFLSKILFFFVSSNTQVNCRSIIISTRHFSSMSLETAEIRAGNDEAEITHFKKHIDFVHHRIAKQLKIIFIPIFINIFFFEKSLHLFATSCCYDYM